MEGSALARTPERTASAIGETASSAVAAQAKASVEARYLVALGRPRNMMQVRSKILEACKRPGFAEVARWGKSVGGTQLEGFSIRFAEEVLRCYMNVLPETRVVYDDPEKRILTISVTDLEANLTYSQDVVVEKTVERKKLKSGQTPIRSRTNTYGDTVYLVEATEDDFANKANALTSKVLRNHVLRLLPGDIQEEARELISETIKCTTAEDPRAQMKKVCDRFYDLGVDAIALETFLGHKIDLTTPAEIDHLRGIWVGLKDGESTWATIMADRQQAAGEKPNGVTHPLATSKGVAGLKEKLDIKAAATTATTASAASTTGTDADMTIVRNRMQALRSREELGEVLSDEEAEDLRNYKLDHPELFAESAS